MHKPLFSYRFIAIAIVLGMLPSTLSIAEPKVKPIYGVNQPIEQIEFRDITVGDALRVLSEQSTLNIVASKEAADIHVTMFLRRATPMEILDAIAKTYNLWYQRDDESKIVRLYTVKEYRLEQVEYRKEETEIFTLKNAKNALDLAETIQNLFSSRVRVSYGQNQQQLMTDLQQRFARFDLVDKRTKQNFNFSSGTTGGQSNTGNSTTGGQNNAGNIGNMSGQSNTGNMGGQYNTGNNPQNTPVVDNATAVKNVQGAIAGDAEENSEFIDNTIQHLAPIHVGVIKHQNRVLVRTRDVDAMNEIKRIKQQLDVESSMLLMEVKILQIELGDGYESLFDFKVKSGDFGVASINAVGSVANALTSAATALNPPALLATVIGKNFDARLQLLEKENRVTLLGTPMLLTANQEVSRFLVGKTLPVLINYTAGSVSGTNTNTLNGNGSQIVLPPAPVYEQRTIGNTLLLTPNINADKTVNIQIVVEESILLKDGATILVPPSANCSTGVLSGGCTPTSENIDVVNEKTFSGSVIASDGATIAVGGLIQEDAANSEEKVPFLGDVPVLGFFFRDEAQARNRKELVVMIKPHIISSPKEAQAISQNMLNENSIHPNIQNPTDMGVYSNPDKQHKGYQLDQKFKEYNTQDSLDRYKWDNPNPRR